MPSAFCRLVHHPSLATHAAVGGLDPAPTRRVRGAAPHLEYSRLQTFDLHSDSSSEVFVAHRKV